MKNMYWVRGEVTAIVLNSPRYGRMETLISTTKLPLAQSYEGTWYANWSPITKSFYCAGRIKLSDGRISTMYLHRWITKCPKNMQVDHFNNNTLDNTDRNLRIVTRSGNQQNRARNQRNNTSGARGVSWDKRYGKWSVSVVVQGKSIHIGRYDTVGEADQAAKEARAKYMPFSKEASSKTGRL
ncbi:AP2 domain-containing protein [Paenibacillus ihumii]|uniref:AP2 domain-containing protein n=1 Tax=Paenibacillus ihumii TaxID=687436 RepID=UPI0006D83AFB|nr:AP2 domain-containing protein [Paenibacillus ihumii]